MSRWTHALCDACSLIAEPDRIEPVRLKDPDPEVCCGCGLPNTSGIYYRDDPDKYRYCKHRD